VKQCLLKTKTTSNIELTPESWTKNLTGGGQFLWQSIALNLRCRWLENISWEKAAADFLKENIILIEQLL
jgi:hypothetical protein